MIWVTSKRRLRLTFLFIALAIISWRFVWRWQPGDDSLSQARQAGVIRIGYAVEAPYAFLTPEAEVTGEAPEIARIIASRLGIPRVEWRLAEFGDLIDGLEAKQFDVIAAGMFITPESERRVSFSQPTFQATAGLLVRKGNPLALHSYSDILQNNSSRIAVLNGSAEEAELLQLGFPNEQLVHVPDASAGRSAVTSGRADALALSAPTIRWMVRHPIAGQTEMADPFHVETGNAPSQPGRGAFVFRKDSLELSRAWNAELAGFIGSDEHRRVLSTFGFTNSELAPAYPGTRSLRSP